MLALRTGYACLAALLALGYLAQGAGATPSAPTCTPTRLNYSALLDGAVTVSPLPGSRDATPQTQISFLGVPASRLSVLSVTGSRSGPHPGRLAPYSQGDGASFLPSRPFTEGELVTVRALLRTGGSSKPLRDQFRVAHQDVLSSTPERTHPGATSEIQSFRSRADLHPPPLTVTTDSSAPASGELLSAPYDGSGQSGPMITEPNGELVWFKALPAHTSASNLQVQQYEGKPALTWWQGDISVHGFGLGEDVIANGAYEDIAHVRAGNGLRADLHDFQLTPAGTALITAYDPIYCNLAGIGGSSQDAVTDSLLQEIDIKTGLVMFQWTSVEHVAFSESHSHTHGSSTRWPFDFFHLNSIERTGENSLLISARNTWTVYELDHSTGQIVWRLGGKHPSFTMGPGTDTAWQHDPRALADNTISIFDNGASPRVHSSSRAIVVRIDPEHKTATLLSQFTHPSMPLVSESQGNVQALANGDWFVGWGQVPDLSEFSPSGTLLLDAHFPAGDQSYRDFRFAWTGTPSHPPAFALARGSGATSTVYASWNGATQVAGWRVLAGSSPTKLRALAEGQRTGFESAIVLPAGATGPYVTVQALGVGGSVLATAPPLARLG